MATVEIAPPPGFVLGDDSEPPPPPRFTEEAPPPSGFVEQSATSTMTDAPPPPGFVLKESTPAQTLDEIRTTVDAGFWTGDTPATENLQSLITPAVSPDALQPSSGERTPVQMTPTGAALRSFGSAIAPAAGGGGAAAATLPVAAALAPVTYGASYLIPLIAGYFGTSATAKAQESLLESGRTEEQINAARTKDAEIRKEFPISSTVGEIAPQLAMFRPSASLNLVNRGVNAAIGAGQDVATKLATGQPVTAEGVLTNAAIGALLDKPTALGRSMGFHDSASITPENVAKYQEGVTEHLKTVSDEALNAASNDPEFKKTVPYDPGLIDVEIQRRKSEALAPLTTEAASQTATPARSTPPPGEPAPPQAKAEPVVDAALPDDSPAGRIRQYIQKDLKPDPEGDVTIGGQKFDSNDVKASREIFLTEASDRIEVATERLDKVKDKHEELKEDLDMLISDRQFEVDRRNEAMEKMKTATPDELTNLREEAKLASEGIADFDKEASKLKAKIAVREKKLAQHQAEVDRLNADLEALDKAEYVDSPSAQATAPKALAQEPVPLLPEQTDVALPKLDVKRSPFALGISPDSKALNWLTANTKRLFTAKGDLPKETFEAWIRRNGEVKAESRNIAYATRDLYGALRDEFGISKTEELTKGFQKVPREFVKKMNDALLGEVDINTLPERVRAPLQAMRDRIDGLSKKMLDEGVIPASLEAKVAENLGVYMTRSYRVFDDPKWAESIPRDVRNKARDFILSNLKKENPSATPANAQAVMEAMLQDWKDQGSGALVKPGGKLGSKDLTSFIERKDIPRVIRQLMGEYGDPSINFARSVTKAASLIGNQRFLNQVRRDGLGKFLFEDGTQPASHSALIAADGSSTMAPLNGLRTTPEIAAAFREFGKSDPTKNGLLRALQYFSGVAKTAKTVGSVMTQARNILGQAYFFAMNGHYDMTKAAPAVKAVLADLGARDTPAGRAAYERYLRLGIVDQSARASELRDTIRDAGLNDPGVSITDPGKIWLKSARKLTLDAAAKAYQVSDDVGKIIGFENELARQREIHPDWSDTTLEAASAERIRNTYPTYSMIPEGVKKIRPLPFAPFASFASETFRTAYHNLRYTIEDLNSSNPAQKKAGAQRLAGQLAVAGSGYAMSAISQALVGMNAQDEDDARRFMAPWDKDSQIVFTGKKDGQSTFVNASYVNPYSYLTDPVISVASGLRDKDQLDQVMLRSFAKLMQPFTSEDILAGSLIDIARNQTPTGRRVFNPGDTAARQWGDKLAHIYSAIEPGTVTRVKTKIIPAIKGETDNYGRKPDLTNEVLSELTGFKTQTLDYAQALQFKARQFKKEDDDADSIFRDVASRRGGVNPDDLTDAYKRAARSKFEAWQEMYRDVQAAQRRGISTSATKTALEARGVSNREASAIVSGKFIPPSVSPSLQKQMKEAKRTLPAAVDQEMRRASGLVLSGDFE